MNLSPSVLQQGIAALKAGDRITARAYFRQALLNNPNDEQAWLWMSGVVTEVSEQRDCLQRVLSINPANQVARKGLAALDAAQVATVTKEAPSPVALTSSPAINPAPRAPISTAASPVEGLQEKRVSAAAVPAQPTEPAASVKPKGGLFTRVIASAPLTASAEPLAEPPVVASATVPLARVEPPVPAQPATPPTALSTAQPTASTTPTVSPRSAPARPRASGAYQHKANEVVGDFRIVERVGSLQGREVYLAGKDDPNWLFWLISEQAPPQINLKGQQERFILGGTHYLAIPAAGSSVADLTAIVPEVRFRFIGPRWVQLSDHIGYLHTQGQVYQQSTPITPENVVFNGNGSGTAVSFNRAAMGVNPYAAPEARQLAFSPASDVYSLAASLLAVMGQAAPEVTFARGTPRVGLLKEAPELYQVLQKATDLEPKRRYPNGERFARALEGLLGRLPAEAEARLAKPKRRRGPIGLIGMMSLAVLLGLFAYGVWRFWPTPQQAEALPVPVPAGVISIPRGDVVISGFNIDFVAEEGVASVAVERGEQPLAQSEQPRLLLQRNGAVLSGQRVEPLQEGRFQIRFALPENPAGMYRVVAQLNGTEAQQARYFAPTENADLTAISTTVELDDLRADGLQVETQRYPDITSYFAVVTLDGAAAKLLGSFDVEVFQDGQPVTDFYLEPVNTAKEPVTVAVVVDVSGSMRGEPIELARQGAASFVRQLGANDTACLYTFATLVRLVVECTNDKAAVITAIEGLQTIDDTALYDALVRVTNDIAQRSGRLAIVVLSDGADTKSQATIAQALEGVRTSSIPVYTIGLLSEQFDGSVLRTLAEGADAIYLEAPQPEAIATLYAQVEQQLASQYRITFRSLFPERRSGEITIRVKQGDEVIEIKREFSVQ